MGSNAEGDRREPIGEPYDNDEGPGESIVAPHAPSGHSITTLRQRQDLEGNPG
jgi:hypothetical protein